MKALQPIYTQDLDIRIQNLEFLSVRLNRHLIETRGVADHTHPHAQILLYLGGAGSQRIMGTTYSVRRGTLYFVPSEVSHGFRAESRRKPLCLAIDLNVEGADEVIDSQLNSLDFNRVRHLLCQLARWRNGNESVEPTEVAALLQVIDVLFRAFGLLSRKSPAKGNKSLLKIVYRTLSEPSAFEQPVSVLASRIGYHPDYLNRMLKDSCGLTLGGLRADIRVQKAKRLLEGQHQIAEVAMDVGFSDPSYFSRWFRHQTGQTPQAWRVKRR